MFIKVVWRITKSNVNNTWKPAGNQSAIRASGKSSDEDNDDVIESFLLYIFSVFPSFVYYYLEETYVKLVFLPWNQIRGSKSFHGIINETAN